MSTSVTKAPRWQTDRAVRLHAEFKALAASIEFEGADLVKGIEVLSAKLSTVVLTGNRKLKASKATLLRAWYDWQKGNRSAQALMPSYSSPAHIRTIPDELAREIQRLASSETGGRDKDGKGIEAPAIRKILQDRWWSGEALPGIGTWQEWWAANHPALPLPALPPEFPWSIKTVQRKRGSKAVQAMGNIGAAAANKHLPTMRRDYSKLRKCELFMLDDVRLDIVAIDEVTGKVVEIVAYIMMEVSSRSIVGFVLKPAKAMRAEDVDELIAHCLQAEGYGIGIGYQTHIWFERGTIACTESAQRILEGGSGDRIKVHRTSMDGGIKWIGAHVDRASGHSAGKAAIESFNRNLHRMLLHLPGQRGNNRENQPANLGVGEKQRKDPSRSIQETIRIESERLAQFKHTAAAKGQRAELKMPLLWVGELHREVTNAIKAYNNRRGHGMQGFHTIKAAEVAPGVWREVSTSL